MLSNAYFLANFRFDTAENEPAKKFQKIANILQNKFTKFANFANPLDEALAGRALGRAASGALLGPALGARAAAKTLTWGRRMHCRNASTNVHCAIYFLGALNNSEFRQKGSWKNWVGRMTKDPIPSSSV